MWEDLIIVQPPRFNGLAGVVEIGKPVLIQGLTTVPPVEAPDAEALHGARGGDEVELDALSARPHVYVPISELAPGVQGNGGWEAREESQALQHLHHPRPVGH